MTKYEEFYPIIEENKNIFENLIEKFQKKPSLEFADKILKFAIHRHTGYYYSNVLEKFYVDIADTIDIKNYDIKFKKNTFLHVMSKAYNWGGHTRVVERWIKNASVEQIHDVVLLNQDDEIPSALSPINLSSEKNIIQKALKLREIALSYEFVILHIHMDDPTAMIAFGTEKFTRPVIFFNHADHMFWIGKSIADKILEIKGLNCISKTKRKILNGEFLGVPTEINSKEILSKKEAREKLNLPENKKIILTIGSDFKFTPIGEENIIPMLKEIIEEDTILYAIGVNKENPNWQGNSQIIPLGIVDYDTLYYDYISACDLVLDGYPLGSGTAIIDAVCCDKPVLSIHNDLGQFDFLIKSDSFCEDKFEFVEKAKKILSDENYAKENTENIKNLLKNELGIENWQNRLNIILNNVQTFHKVKVISEKEPNFIDDAGVMLNLMYNKNWKKSIKFKARIKYFIYKYVLNKPEKACEYYIYTL